MNLLSIKSILISTQIGRILDAYLRIALSLLPFFHSLILHSNSKRISPDGFILFLYGGIGDVIMTIPLMNNLSKHGKLILYCDERIAELKFLFPVNSIIYLYNKNQIFNLQRIDIDIGNYIYIRTSPIIELYLIGILIGVKYSFGFIMNFYSINAIGFKLKSSDNKISNLSKEESYQHLYKILASTAVLKSLESKIPTEYDSDLNNTTSILNKKYVVFSTTKTPQWKAGKIEVKEYIKVAEYLIECIDCEILFVGSSSEAEEINNIINLSEHKKRLINFAGKTSIKSLVNILKGALFVVANDNGVAHLTSYFSIRIIVIYTFSDHNVYKWNNSNYISLYIRNTPCSPCVSLNKYPQDNYPVICNFSFACSKSISADSIITKIKSTNWLLN